MNWAYLPSDNSTRKQHKVTQEVELKPSYQQSYQSMSGSSWAALTVFQSSVLNFIFYIYSLFNLCLLKFEVKKKKSMCSGLVITGRYHITSITTWFYTSIFVRVKETRYNVLVSFRGASGIPIFINVNRILDEPGTCASRNIKEHQVHHKTAWHKIRIPYSWLQLHIHQTDMRVVLIFQSEESRSGTRTSGFNQNPIDIYNKANN